jgi:hypothetical protein
MIYIVLTLIIAVLVAALVWEQRAYALLVRQWEDEKADCDDARKSWISADVARMEAEEARARAESALNVFVGYEQGLLEGLANNERLLTAQARANEKLCAERDEAQELQHLDSLRFGNAQSMLIQALGDTLRGYNGYRAAHGDKPIELDQGLQQIMKERDQV